jgi:glucosamine--fructose-6-phosphate aminotransferase (isomerizing)
VVGFGEGENFLASAVQALLGETHEFLVVENGEIVEITDSSAASSPSRASRSSARPSRWTGTWRQVELGGYEDFMLKEIHEQPAASAPPSSVASTPTVPWTSRRRAWTL